MTMPLDLHVSLALFQATLLPLPQGSGLALGQGYCLPVADILHAPFPCPHLSEKPIQLPPLFPHSIPKMGIRRD